MNSQDGLFRRQFLSLRLGTGPGLWPPKFVFRRCIGQRSYAEPVIPRAPRAARSIEGGRSARPVLPIPRGSRPAMMACTTSGERTQDGLFRRQFLVSEARIGRRSLAPQIRFPQMHWTAGSYAEPVIPRAPRAGQPMRVHDHRSERSPVRSVGWQHYRVRPPCRGASAAIGTR